MILLLWPLKICVFEKGSSELEGSIRALPTIVSAALSITPQNGLATNRVLTDILLSI